MSTRSLLRPAGLVAATGLLAVGLVVSLAQPKPAAAASGLEQLVGTISPAVRAQLPADPRIYGAYALRPTPDRCRNGSFACIDTTIRSMRQRFDALAPRCDHDAVFSLLYLRVTERYKVVAATPGSFGSVRTVNWEDAVFYDLYAGAYADWHANRPLQVPPAWRLAFAAADARQASAAGDALLGMVAHILRDLPFGLWRISMGTHSDHLVINTMLRQVYSSVVAEIARRFDPLMAAGDVVPGTSMLVVDAIAQWREQAWRDGLDLVNARNQAAFDAVAQRIERNAWLTSLSIYLATRYPVQQLTVVRDAYCATHWNT